MAPTARSAPASRPAVWPVVGVQSTLSVWPPAPHRCRPKLGADGAANMSLFAPRHWRGGFPRRLGASFHGGRALTNEILSSRFAAVRIRPASRDRKVSTPHRLAWLLIEWPEGEKEPTKYWLSTLPEDTLIDVLVDTPNCAGASSATTRNSKAKLGHAHFEGRSWRGFHHHATLCHRREWRFPLRPPAAPNIPHTHPVPDPESDRLPPADRCQRKIEMSPDCAQ
jgi:SRSO17 transposase